MSQRESGYERIERDCYETPEWVTRALLPHLGNIKSVWEPAAGSGKMARVLEAAGLQVLSTDISAGQDFLLAGKQSVDAIVTNPPYTSAALFIEHALRLMSGGGKVAMLLRTDFDHAKTRWHLFCGLSRIRPQDRPHKAHPVVRKLYRPTIFQSRLVHLGSSARWQANP